MSQFIEMVGELRTNTKGWPIKALPELATYSIGLTYKPEDVFEEGIIVLRSGNIQDSKLILDDVVRVKCPIKETLYILEDDILMCSRNGSAALVGKVAQIKEINEPMTYGAFMTVIRSDYSDFLFLYFQSNDFREQVSTGKSSTMNQITQNMLDKISVPFPDEDTRNRLSEILHQADKSEFVGFKSQFIEMFGDPSIDTKWPTKKLKDLGSLDRGVSKARPRNTPELLGGPYPLIQTGDITEAKLYIKDYQQTYSELGLAQSKMWKRGTLCITIAANIAQTAILDIDACFPDSVVGFISNEVEAIFIHYWFSFIQQVLERQAPQTAQKNINLKILSELDVIVPPKELQIKFVNIVLQADKSEKCCEFRLAS